ncbi:class I SAM-dependent methyltransferase [Allokutzneria albata]|uniref:Methyltransferase domain-containing protein n=1 Tax=Allokutzneria albata TaxID=211114 RepID=A0A1G9TD08_ALLAB|nr:methyltransferase domain-containing protein [Allokutzneria albata]SDM45581.1 Methyltransferase domain-containing protein [Allokutzneria albata]
MAVNPDRIFDGLLGRISALVMAGGNRAAEAEAVAELDPRPHDRVLVVGFGPGVGLRLLAERLPEGHIAGIDPSAVMLRAATRRNRRAIAAGRMELHRGKADALPFPDADFDGVITVNTIQFWEPLEASVREVARVLRPGGRLVSHTHDWAITRTTGRDVETWARATAEVCLRAGLGSARHWRARAEKGKSVAFTARKPE